jgi:hypothetical protein
LAPAFPTSALRQERKGRGPTTLVMPARSKAWATRHFAQEKQV